MLTSSHRRILGWVHTLLVLALGFTHSATLGQTSYSIRLNQVGFYPEGPKLAVVLNTSSAPFYITTPSLTDTVFQGVLSESTKWPHSDENVSRAEFSALTTTGTFVLVVPGIGYSPPFEIQPHVHQTLAAASLKGFYYQRCSTRLYPEHAGLWARSAGHPDTSVLVHPSAASIQRPANSAIRVPLGWYDAGDYNKYVVNSGISTSTLLSTYEHFTQYCALFSTNIPESANDLPDILDEVLWNLRWMLAMQDPSDGGVYTKLTNPNFDGWVMPNSATQPRYVVMKSTGAALDLAAVAAQAARVFSAFSGALPGFADSCLEASLGAWRWARQHPSVFYNQSLMNQQYSPSINTGEYGDWSFQDEFDWAAAELYVTTKADSFLTVANPLTSLTTSPPSWQNVRTLGLYSLAHHKQQLTGYVDTSLVISRIASLAGMLRSSWQSSAYQVPMGVGSSDFVWGSNGVAANQGMALLIAYQNTGDSTFLEAAQANLDYLLGRNATTYCFVTGFGAQSPKKPHHRVSQADGVLDPVPGLLVGGPNPGQEDHVPGYPSSLPALSYLDHVDSYASNEIAINWNAPLVYLALGIEALWSPTGPALQVSDKLLNRVPERFGLLRNYPNPFNPNTLIRFTLPWQAIVSIRVYSVLGSEVANLVEEELPAGVHEREWHTGNLSSGVYICRLIAMPRGRAPEMTAHSETVRMVLVR